MIFAICLTNKKYLYEKDKIIISVTSCNIVFGFM